MRFVVACFFLKGVKTADTGSEDNSHAVVVNALSVDAGIGNGLAGSHESILGIEVVLTHLFAVEMLGRIVVLHLTAKLGLEQ